VGVNDTPRPLYPRKRPGTQCIGGSVGTSAGLDRCRKSRPLPGFNPRTVQPVASRYTDCSVPAHVPRQMSAKSLNVKLSDHGECILFVRGVNAFLLWLPHLCSLRHSRTETTAENIRYNKLCSLCGTSLDTRNI
jgi:hypothetical protein